MGPSAPSVDVAVVGAGPAGCAAAITLARSGLDVVVLDRSTFPRDKACGDGLTVWALRELEQLGWTPAATPGLVRVDSAWVGSPSRRLVEFPLPDDGLFAAVVRRTELDHSLVRLATQEGAKVLDGDACTGATEDDVGVHLCTATGSTLHARFAIGADGMWSPLRRYLGGSLGGYRGDWHALRQYATGVGPPASTQLYAWFEPDFLPGYAWSFPTGEGTANIGFGILRASRWPVGAMAALWRELLARPHIADTLGPDALLEGTPRAWPIPCTLGAAPTSLGRRVLFAGDAAAVADPLTGEGIGQALATGRWAAEAILATPPADPGRAAVTYADRLERDLGPDHRMSWLLNRALSHRKGARTAIRVASTNAWTRRNFARWLFEDYPRGIALTPRRWRRGVLSGPGAFR